MSNTYPVYPQIQPNPTYYGQVYPQYSSAFYLTQEAYFALEIFKNQEFKNAELAAKQAKELVKALRDAPSV